MDTQDSHGPRRRLFVNRQGSPERVDERTQCKVQQDCGSCKNLSEPYSLHLAGKTRALRELVAQCQSPLLKQVPVRDCSPSPQSQSYRHTAKLVVAATQPQAGRPGTEGSKPWINIGLYKPTTHRVIDIGRCLMQSDRINDVVAYLRSELGKQNIPIYNERTRRGLLRYIVLRQSASDGQMLITLVASADSPLFKTFAREMGNRFSFINGVMLHINKSQGNAIFASGDDETPAGELSPLTGITSLQERMGNLKLRVSSTSFMQVNPKLAERIYNRMVELAEPRPTESVLDLYSGVGTIGLTFAPYAAAVVGIEETPSSVADATYNAEQNGLRNTRFLQGRVEDVLGQLGSLEPALGIVTLNPSRRGCQKTVLDKLASLKPRQMLYMSCNPKTLLRDLEILEAAGYRTTTLEPFDMFPRTPHYEVLAHLVPSENP